MAYRALEITHVSARDLKRVNLVTPMEVYAVASVSVDPQTRHSTLTDRHGGRNPTWNTTLRFAVPPTAAAASAARAFLHVVLRTKRALGDRDVGEVFVPLADLLAGPCDGAAGGGPSAPTRFVSYQVRKVQSAEPRGVLTLSYRLGSVVVPQLPQATNRGDAAAAPGYGQLVPYRPPNVYPPPSRTQPAGCAAAPPMQGRNNGNNFGLALGAAIGGMPVGDMIGSETAYDAGYRAGFADGGRVTF